VTPPWPATRSGSRMPVYLAQFQERPAARQQPQRRVGQLTGQRIQHDVDPGAAVVAEEPCLEFRRTRRGDVPVVKAHLPQHPVLARARGRDTPPAQGAGQWRQPPYRPRRSPREPAPAAPSAHPPGRPARTTPSAKAIGTDAAAANDHPAGTRASSRASVTTTGPNPPSARPSTRSPVVRPVTSGPVSVTTPATSLPSTPAPGSLSGGSMPSAISDVTEVHPGRANRHPRLACLERAGRRGVFRQYQRHPASLARSPPAATASRRPAVSAHSTGA
jgi:hypothetical protein